jgi:uncharacterized damage-inducible protein DinB
VRTRLVKAFLLWLLLSTPMLFAQEVGEGLWQGYEGEWEHVSSQLIALAEATPAANFAWRPAPGVRSTSEVYMHLVTANFYMLDLAGQKAPVGVNRDMGKKVTSKAEVIEWLKRSLEAVKRAHSAVTAADLARRVHADGTDTTIGNVYLRMIVHNNEHMGQLVAYARMTGVVPPWSKN